MRIVTICLYLLLATPAALAQQEPTLGQRLDDFLSKGEELAIEGLELGSDVAGDFFENTGDILGDIHPHSRYCIAPPIASAELCDLLSRNAEVLLDTAIGRLGTRLAEAADKGQTQQLKDDAQAIITAWQTPEVMDIQEQRSTGSIWSTFEKEGYFSLFGTNFGGLLETSFALQLKACGEAPGNTAACTISDAARQKLAESLDIVEQYDKRGTDLWAWFRTRYNLTDTLPPKSF